MAKFKDLMKRAESSQPAKVLIQSERFAVVSDIHANLEALTAVLTDIKKRDITEIVNLGDLVGYGPDPGACVELASEFTANLMGNHDVGVLIKDSDPYANSTAKQSWKWTRKQLNQSHRRFLNALPFQLRIQYHGNTTEAYHGSPQPGQFFNEYVFPLRTVNPGSEQITQDELFRYVERMCFVGHTHCALILPETTDATWPDPGDTYLFSKPGKVTLNPGSVGQPRDDNPKASYFWVDSKGAHFERVAYDIDATAKKMRDRGCANGPGSSAFMRSLFTEQLVARLYEGK